MEAAAVPVSLRCACPSLTHIRAVGACSPARRCTPHGRTMFVWLAGIFASVASLLVTPTPAGWLARRLLATALRGCRELAWRCCDVASGDVGADGRLAAASGVSSPGMSIDSGLRPHTYPLHMLSAQLGTACQEALVLAAVARWEVDVWRPTHLLPYRPFWLLAVLARSLLSATSQLLYQLHSGRLDATQLHARRERLLAAADAFRACCGSVAACLESNRPVSEALAALRGLHVAFAGLGEAATAAPRELWGQPGMLACSAWCTLLFNAAARVRA